MSGDVMEVYEDPLLIASASESNVKPGSWLRD
jgi:hypothetical protein